MANVDADDVIIGADRGRWRFASPLPHVCASAFGRKRGGNAFGFRSCRVARRGADQARRIAELIGLVFDVALDPAAWPRTLDELADTTGVSPPSEPTTRGRTPSVFGATPGPRSYHDYRVGHNRLLRRPTVSAVKPIGNDKGRPVIGGGVCVDRSVRLAQ
jgi:hypothetical protein